VESHPGCWGPPASRPFQGGERFTSERIGLHHKPRGKDHGLGRRAGALGISLISSWKRMRCRFTRLGSGCVWRGCGVPGRESSILHLTRQFTQRRGTRLKQGIAFAPLASMESPNQGPALRGSVVRGNDPLYIEDCGLETLTMRFSTRSSIPLSPYKRPDRQDAILCYCPGP
jgi:hypothetical protein